MNAAQSKHHTIENRKAVKDGTTYMRRNGHQIPSRLATGRQKRRGRAGPNPRLGWIAQGARALAKRSDGTGIYRITREKRDELNSGEDLPSWVGSLEQEQF